MAGQCAAVLDELRADPELVAEIESIFASCIESADRPDPRPPLHRRVVATRCAPPPRHSDVPETVPSRERVTAIRRRGRARQRGPPGPVLASQQNRIRTRR
jgi:hypothetical protein